MMLLVVGAAGVAAAFPAAACLSIGHICSVLGTVFVRWFRVVVSAAGLRGSGFFLRYRRSYAALSWRPGWEAAVSGAAVFLKRVGIE